MPCSSTRPGLHSRCPPSTRTVSKAARVEVARGIELIEDRAAQALLQGEGSPDVLRELVLATRHLLRIADQLARMPGEITRFQATTGDHPEPRADPDA